MSLPPLIYDDDTIRNVLNSVTNIAIIGASVNPRRASNGVSQFLMRKGYQITPINPGHVGGTILDQPCYANLADIPDPFQMVDIFRNSEAVPEIVEEATRLADHKGISVIWMQLGVRHDEAAARAEAAGMTVIMDRCPKIEIARLF